MRRIPVDVETIGRQQDLIGFFNSVPHRRIQEDVEYVVHRYCAAQGVSIDSVLHVHQNQKEEFSASFKENIAPNPYSIVPFASEISWKLQSSCFITVSFSWAGKSTANIWELPWVPNGPQWFARL